MKIAIVSFTKAGSSLNHTIEKSLKDLHECNGYYKGRCEEQVHLTEITNGIQEWCGSIFDKVDGLIFIGACGIAVRAIAPYIKDKTKDPLVLVIDERATFVISLLSGHIGGGNELALQLSEQLQATPVITTATDINEHFAVDVFAKKEELFILDMKLAKEVSALILEGKKIAITSQIEIIGNIPSELIQVQEAEESGGVGICISENEEEKPFLQTLNLIPRSIVLGLGCKKNTKVEQFEAFILETLKENRISIHAVKAMVSIDLKKEEPCMKHFTKKYEIPFVTYSAEELSRVEGVFEESDFVKQITGVGNVCERSAMKGCSNPVLLKGKKALNGMTIALATEKIRRQIRFE